MDSRPSRATHPDTCYMGISLFGRCPNHPAVIKVHIRSYSPPQFRCHELRVCTIICMCVCNTNVGTVLPFSLLCTFYSLIKKSLIPLITSSPQNYILFLQVFLDLSNASKIYRGHVHDDVGGLHQENPRLT